MSGLRSVSDYAAALAAMMPRGRAWPMAGGRIWGQLMAALSPELRRLDARALQLLEEADPRTCAETLEDWERVLDLPDPCTPGDATLTERRDAVVSLLRFEGGASIAYFVQLAAARGYAVSVTEYRPLACGRSPCGHQINRQPLGPPSMRSVWSVAFAARRRRWFQIGVGGSQCGFDPHLSIDRVTEIECLIRRFAPAQSVVVFDYSAAA